MSPPHDNSIPDLSTPKSKENEPSKRDRISRFRRTRDELIFLFNRSTLEITTSDTAALLLGMRASIIKRIRILQNLRTEWNMFFRPEDVSTFLLCEMPCLQNCSRYLSFILVVCTYTLCIPTNNNLRRCDWWWIKAFYIILYNHRGKTYYGVSSIFWEWKYHLFQLYKVIWFPFAIIRTF